MRRMADARSSKRSWHWSWFLARRAGRVLSRRTRCPLASRRDAVRLATPSPMQARAASSRTVPGAASAAWIMARATGPCEPRGRPVFIRALYRLRLSAKGGTVPRPARPHPRCPASIARRRCPSRVETRQRDPAPRCRRWPGYGGLSRLARLIEYEIVVSRSWESACGARRTPTCSAAPHRPGHAPRRRPGVRQRISREEPRYGQRRATRSAAD